MMSQDVFKLIFFEPLNNDNHQRLGKQGDMVKVLQFSSVISLMNDDIKSSHYIHVAMPKGSGWTLLRRNNLLSFARVLRSRLCLHIRQTNSAALSATSHCFFFF